MVNEKKIKTIEIIAKELKTKEGKDFIGYKVVCKDGRLMDASFCRGVAPVQKNSLITAYAEDLSLDKNRKFPRLYIRGYIKAEEINYDLTTGEVEELPF